MKHAYQFIFIISLIFTPYFSSHAQIWLSNEDIYNEAEEYLNAEEYVEALPLYLLLEKKGMINSNLHYKIGTCYLNTRGKKHKSLEYLRSAAQNTTSVYVNTYSESRAPHRAIVLLGIAYRINNELDKAIQTFEIYRDSVIKSKPELGSMIDMHITRCENARLLGAFPGESRTEKLPSQINTVYSNFNPVLVRDDSLLFYMEELKFYDAIMSVQMEQGEWGNPVNLTPSIGSDGDHYLVGASPKGDKLLLHHYEVLKAGEIYAVEYGERGWSDMVPLNDNVNSQYNETHACYSSDGLTLFFTSNRPGGFGGLDIYMSKRDSADQWGPAVNLGPSVNTPFNEECPIINNENTILYFSSQGHLNMGGYDVFYSIRRGENKWMRPINMGTPVCTTDDDLFYYPLAGTVSGLMSRLDISDNTGYDIYKYNSMVFPNTPRFSVKGKTKNGDTSVLEEHEIVVLNQQTSDTILTTHTDSKGEYGMLLPAGNFTVLAIDGSGKTGKTNIQLSDAHEGTLMLVPEKQETEDIPELKTVAGDTIILRNILFSFDDSYLSLPDRNYLKSIRNAMQNHSELQFLIEGFTDALGSEKYNLWLSEKRAGTIAEYLISQGVDRNRLKIQGYGEARPQAINRNPDGTDNAEGRRFNRRVTLVPINKPGNVEFIKPEEIPLDLRKIVD